MNRSGFTLIEVMMAVAILSIGAAGIMAMQYASTRANMESRQFSTAIEVNRIWLERIRTDALGWTTKADRSATQYLSDDVPSSWFVPQPANLGPTESYAFDYQGGDTAVESEMVYCTLMQTRWLDTDSALRVDVRTWWHRRGTGVGDVQSDQSLYANCGQGDEGALVAELGVIPRRLHLIHTSVIVRWNGS